MIGRRNVPEGTSSERAKSFGGDGLEVERSDGTTMERRNRVTLWRCGQSKLLCDGNKRDVRCFG